MSYLKLPPDYVIVFTDEGLETFITLKHKNYALYGSLCMDHSIHMAKAMRDLVDQLEAVVKRGTYTNGKPLERD